MKKNYLWLLTALFIVIAGRLMLMFWFKDDPAFFLSPRNFNGRGMLIMPHWLDFLLPLSTILILYRQPSPGFKKRPFFKILLFSAVLLIVPVTAGLILSNYYRQLWVTGELGPINILHFIYFMLSFYAIQLFTDRLTGRKKIVRYVVAGIYVVFLSVLEDVFLSENVGFSLIGILNSPGLFIALSAWAVRPFYKKHPLETLVALALVGLFIHFMLINVISFSYFTLFLPLTAMVMAAVAVRSAERKRVMI